VTPMIVTATSFTRMTLPIAAVDPEKRRCQ
jgi:hypothetical protein